MTTFLISLAAFAFSCIGMFSCMFYRAGWRVTFITSQICLVSFVLTLLSALMLFGSQNAR